MKVIVNDEDNFTIYLNTYNLDKLNINKKESVQEQLKDIFLKVKSMYDIEIEGYYEVNIYQNDNYGMIIDINNVYDDFDFDFGIVDVKIKINKKSKFLYKVEDDFFLKKIKAKYNKYIYNKCLYIELTENKYDENMMMCLLEHSDIIFGEIVDKIIKYKI